jgi:type IV pilus assembly protein PilV
MKIDNQKGFTIIEALIAITLLAVGILAAATMQISAITGNSHANRVTEATVLATDLLEELMAAPWDDPALAEDPALDPEGHSRVSADGKYTLSWTVVDNDPAVNNLPGNSKTVTITADNVRGVSLVYIKANEG